MRNTYNSPVSYSELSIVAADGGAGIQASCVKECAWQSWKMALVDYLKASATFMESSWERRGKINECDPDFSG